MVEDYSVQLAQPEHLPLLPEIEREAWSLFRGWDVPMGGPDVAVALADLRAAQAAGLLWVALSPEHEPVGFALVERDGAHLHLKELDVHPQHGRTGLGTALVEAVCSWGREAGCREITLTTFRGIPWNEPWYARLGFEVLGGAELTVQLRRILEEEATRGLDPDRRVAMRMQLGPGARDSCKE